MESHAVIWLVNFNSQKRLSSVQGQFIDFQTKTSLRLDFYFKQQILIGMNEYRTKHWLVYHFSIWVLRTHGYVGLWEAVNVDPCSASLFRKEKIRKYFKPSESNDQVAQWEVESCWDSCDVDDVQGDNNLLAECLESNLHFVATSLGIFHNFHYCAVQCTVV